MYTLVTDKRRERAFMNIRKLIIVFITIVFAGCFLLVGVSVAVSEPFRFAKNTKHFISDNILYIATEEQSSSAVLDLFLHGDKMTVSDEVIGTGDVISIDGNSVTALVFGDVNGDGKIQGLDYLKIKKNITEPESLTGVYFLAGDLNCDGLINSSDYFKVRKHFNGNYNIFENIPEKVKPTETVYDELPEQYVNSVYYFQQGYTDNWALNCTEDGRYLNGDEKLVVEFTDNSSGKHGVYRVYKQKEHDDMTMWASLEFMFNMAVDSERDLYFNSNMGVRDDFIITSPKMIESTINGYEFGVATYTFTKDGVQWQGEFYLLPSSRQYYVISYEAPVSEWEAYSETFKEMINNFYPKGFAE